MEGASFKTLYWTGGLLLGICALILSGCLVRQKTVAQNKVTGEDVRNIMHGDFDTFFRVYYQDWMKMRGQLEALQERTVFDDVILTNKANLESEIIKRIAGEKIISDSATKALSTTVDFKRECSALQVEQEYKQGVLEDLDKSFPQDQAMFALWANSQKTEQAFLQFLYDRFQDYQLKDGEILFGNQSNERQYRLLAKAVQDAAAIIE